MSQPVTVGVLTHKRATAFEAMLNHLIVSIDHYNGECFLFVINNSGKEENTQVRSIIERSGIKSTCSVRIMDSPINNISIGRNIILDNTHTKLLLFIDDDEYPNFDWITQLVKQYERCKTMAVAGPIEPIFPDSAPGWVRMIDLHNKENLKTGDTLSIAATGNCILDLSQVKDVRLNPEDGLAGGEDTAFFHKLTSSGKVITWCNEAIVQESVSKERSTARYMIFRFMKHGQMYKRVVLNKQSGIKLTLSLIRATFIAIIGIMIACFTLPFSDRLCSLWMKRGFTNLGKVIPISKPLYGWEGSY